MTDRNWKATFESIFDEPASRVEAEVWSRVLRDDYPLGLDTYSWTTWSELQRIADDLRCRSDDLLLDVVCGRGGPGLWVAATTGCHLLGLDIADAAVAAAQKRAVALGLDGRARFRTGTFDDTGLEDASVDAIMSVDALLFATDKARALRELGRILRPGGRLALTSWDYSGQPPNRPPQVADHRPLAEAAGLHVTAYDETPDWRVLQEATVDGLLERVEDLAADRGETPDQVRAGIGEMRATMRYMTRRFLLLAQKL
jgi:SAM-dependent methyltransferase